MNKIETLRVKGANGEEYNLYPRTLIDCISNKNGDKLEDVLQEYLTTQFQDTYASKEFVAETVANADHLRRTIVTTIPTVEEAEDNVIYMYKVESAVGNDVYQEYQLINGEVVLIGDTSVDLSDYVKNEVLDKILSGELIVGDANKLGNQPPSYYATARSVEDIVSGATSVGNAEKLNGLTAEEFVSNGNLLINTDFSNPVNTNGLTEYNYESTKICIDGWYINKNAIVTLGNDGISVTHKGESAEQTGYFCQRIYNLDYYAGKTVTLSVKANGVIYSETVTFPDNIADNDIILDSYGMHLSQNKSFFDLYKYNTWDYMEVRYIVNKSYTDTVLIEWIKLELGSIATPYIPSNKEVEKLKCTGSVDKLGGETDEEWQGKIDNIQTTSRGDLSQTGWYRVAEISGDLNTSSACEIIIKRLWGNTVPENHAFDYSYVIDTSKKSIFHKYSTSNAQLVTKIRSVYDSTLFKHFIEIYYNSTILNTVVTFISHGETSIISSWQAITPTLTQETVEGVTVTTTYDIPANASPVTDLDLVRFKGHKAINNQSLLSFALTLPEGTHEYLVGNMTDYVSELPNPMYQYGAVTIKVYYKNNYVEVILWGHKHSNACNTARIYYADGEWGSWLVDATKSDLTTALAGYLPLDGSKAMSGDLTITGSDNGRVFVDNYVIPHKMSLVSSGAGNVGLYDESNTKWIVKSDKNGVVYIDGENKPLHTGNKPSGSYTGNGSAEARAINTGGIGNVCVIFSEKGIVLLTPHGGIVAQKTSGSNATSLTGLAFENGTIGMTSTSELINTSGVTYQYQVL